MKRRLISFDWAMKKLLRSKANFDILEGFLSELLHDDITILEILESESNKETVTDKYNRVDLKVKTKNDEVVIIEVQYDREYDYFHRLAYASSKVITEHLEAGAPYRDVVKVISVNIIYFELGAGEDYVYQGTTNFKGIHTKNHLTLSAIQKNLYKREHIQGIYPEYYLIKINNFNDLAKDSLDEWIYFLKNEEIKDSFSAKGLKKAKAELDVIHMDESERLAYEKHQDTLHHEASIVTSNFDAGKLEGEAEGIKKGVEQGIEQGIELGIEQERIKQQARLLEEKQSSAKKMKESGIAISAIAQFIDLTEDEISAL